MENAAQPQEHLTSSPSYETLHLLPTERPISLEDFDRKWFQINREIFVTNLRIFRLDIFDVLVDIAQNERCDIRFNLKHFRRIVVATLIH